MGLTIIGNLFIDYNIATHTKERCKMTSSKVYVLEPKTNSPAERDELGKAIGALAKKINEPVFFRDYSGAVGGAPVVLLECSATFLEHVKKLAEFSSVRENPPQPATSRSAALWSYFTGEPPMPSRGPGVKPPRHHKP